MFSLLNFCTATKFVSAETDLPGYSYTKPPYVKVGLSSSTGTYVHNFKLKNFEVKGVSL